MTKEKLVPQLRFKGFEGEWINGKLIDLLQSEDGIRRGPFGSSLKKADFVENSPYVIYEQHTAIYDTYETRYFISEEKYKKLQSFAVYPGDFLLSGAGTIGKISKVPDGIKAGVFNQALIRLRVSTQTDSDYFLQLMKSPDTQKKLKSGNPGSAIQNLRPMKEIKKLDFIFPEKEEQQKIGSFFEKLDELINSNQSIIKSKKSYRKALLQKILPTEKSVSPRLRFGDFDNEWINSKLDKYLFIPEKEPIKNVSLGDIITLKLNLGGIVSGSNRETLSLGSTVYYKRHSGQLLYGKQNFFNGSVAIIPEKFNGKVTSGDVPSFNIEGIDSDYLFTFISRPDYYKAKEAQSIGTGSKRIHEKTFLKFPISVPSLPEQQKIGQLFQKLDQEINLYEQKIQHLKQLKKGYLQKLFC